MRIIPVIVSLFLLCACSSENSPPKNKGVLYPVKAWDMRINGEVSILYDINDAGNVENLRIIKSRPYMMFDKNVRDTVKKWKFESSHPKKDIPLTFEFKANR